MICKQIIKFDNDTSFYNGILECIKRGLTFEAFEDKLCIYLTGGF